MLLQTLHYFNQKYRQKKLQRLEEAEKSNSGCLAASQAYVLLPLSVRFTHRIYSPSIPHNSLSPVRDINWYISSYLLPRRFPVQRGQVVEREKTSRQEFCRNVTRLTHHGQTFVNPASITPALRYYSYFRNSSYTCKPRIIHLCRW